jgi:hypothetical protein
MDRIVLARIGLVMLASALSACGGGGDSGSQAGAASNVSVTHLGPTEIVAGRTGVFSATVSNKGTQAATNVGITYRVDDGFGTPTVTCTASGGASCPAAPGPSMSLASLPAGGELALLVTVPVPADARGAFKTTLGATSAGDTDPADNAVTLSPIAQDPRSGAYTAFATDGGQYTLTIDYVARSYRMSGIGVDESGSLEITADGTAKAAGSLRWFRSGPDFVAGGFDFVPGQGQAFVAARSFVATVAELSGTFNVAGITKNGSVLDSGIFSTRLAGSTYQLCANAAVITIDACPLASVRTYTVSLSRDEFVATPLSGDALRFRVARVGDALLYLRAERGTSTGDVFRIGLTPVGMTIANSAGITLHGMSTEAGWQTVDARLTGGTDQAHAITARAGAALAFPTLNAASFVGAPEGVYVAVRASDSASAFVFEHPLMTYVVGARNGPMAGRAAIFVP